jgi:hypothetical protein
VMPKAAKAEDCAAERLALVVAAALGIGSWSCADGER